MTGTLAIRASRTLTRNSRHHLAIAGFRRLPSSPSRFVSFRGFCHRTDNNAAVQIVEVDLDAEGSSAGLRRVEDAIHGILVRRSAPDWLPFVPGSSYWVPPARSHAIAGGVANMFKRLANPLSEEETLSLTTKRGWPSLAYFIDGALPHPVKSIIEEPTAKPDEKERSDAAE